MKTRRKKKRIRKSTVWSIFLFLTISCLVVAIKSNHASEIKEDKMNLASASKIKSPGIPPIDEMAPSKIETASFGLG